MSKFIFSTFSAYSSPFDSVASSAAGADPPAEIPPVMPNISGNELSLFGKTLSISISWFSFYNYYIAGISEEMFIMLIPVVFKVSYINK